MQNKTEEKRSPEEEEEESNERAQQFKFAPIPSSLQLKPIAYFKSCFTRKNGTPRQGALCPQAKGVIELIPENCFGTNTTHHSLTNLSEFSHLWIIYYFHDNGDSFHNSKLRTFVRAPRLNGGKVGLFATRSPHRPNPIGLTLAKIENVDVGNGSVTVSSIDLIHNTPILDIKPYVPYCDCPVPLPPNLIETSAYTTTTTASSPSPSSSSSSSATTTTIITPTSSSSLSAAAASETVTSPVSPEEQLASNTTIQKVRVPKWITEESPIAQVDYEEKALQSLHQIIQQKKLKFYTNVEEIKASIVQVLKTDPRSVYRKTKCEHKIYWFHLDELNVTVKFERVEEKAEEEASTVPSMKKKMAKVKAIIVDVDFWETYDISQI